MSQRRDVGLDVHKDTIVMAVAEEGQSEAVVLGTFPHDVAKLIKRLVKLEPEVSRLRVCYEAGPTGFGLCRRLKKAGIDCVVVAPSLVPQQGSRVEDATERVKRLSKKIERFVEQTALAPLVKALKSFGCNRPSGC